MIKRLWVQSTVSATPFSSTLYLDLDHFLYFKGVVKQVPRGSASLLSSVLKNCLAERLWVNQAHSFKVEQVIFNFVIKIGSVTQTDNQQERHFKQGLQWS